MAHLVTLSTSLLQRCWSSRSWILVDVLCCYIRNKRRTRSFQTTRRGGQLRWRLFSFSDGVFYLIYDVGGKREMVDANGTKQNIVL